jgi:hypothetical protein
MNRWPFTFGHHMLESGRCVFLSRSRASCGVEDWRLAKGMGVVVESLRDEKEKEDVVESPSEEKGKEGDDRPGSQRKSKPRKKAQKMGRGLFMGQASN